MIAFSLQALLVTALVAGLWSLVDCWRRSKAILEGLAQDYRWIEARSRAAEQTNVVPLNEGKLFTLPLSQRRLEEPMFDQLCAAA